MLNKVKFANMREQVAYIEHLLPTRMSIEPHIELVKKTDLLESFGLSDCLVQHVLSFLALKLRDHPEHRVVVHSWASDELEDVASECQVLFSGPDGVVVVTAIVVVVVVVASVVDGLFGCCYVVVGICGFVRVSVLLRVVVGW